MLNSRQDEIKILAAYYDEMYNKFDDDVHELYHTIEQNVKRLEELKKERNKYEALVLAYEYELERLKQGGLTL